MTYELYEWRPSGSPLASRAEIRRIPRTYQAAVPPPIADVSLRMPDDVLALAEEAALAVARFDTEMGGELAPFGSVLLRSESAASSQIENLTASARQIAEAELGTGVKQNAQLIVANVRAMSAALDLSDRLDAPAILSMHRALLEVSDPALAGHWREDQVWIGGDNVSPHGAMFIPPHHRRVSAAIDDLLTFIRRDDLPVIPQAAVAHAHFETIHPFADGNGRTGRSLIHAMLRNKGLTTRATVPVSAGLLTDTQAYFEALTDYRRGEPSAMVRQLAEASFRAVSNGTELVSGLRRVENAWRERISVRRHALAWRVADLVLRHPVINAEFVSRELNIALPNVYRVIQPLVDAKVLSEFTYQKRNRAWRAPEVLAELDAFASRAGHRRRH